MRHAVMISIHPEWCRKIAKHEKTIEVRKTVPKKVNPPFKCYIYQTLPKSGDWNDYDGRVIGEFICDAVLPLMFYFSDPEAQTTHYEVPGTCLSDVEIMEYLGNGVEGHGLHISALTIYDKPRKLSEFRRWCPNDLYCESCAMFNEHTQKCGNAALILKRPPQSWMYVEELE